MKSPISLIFAIIILFTSSAYAQEQRGIGLQNSSASANRRIALVIGNGAYATSPLKNPPNDATDMAAALSQVGFTVEHGVNLTQRQMKFMIREFGQKLKGGGQGLFYFAGHGVQMKGRNYLIPVDAEIASEADVEDQGVDANLVMGLMDEAGNGLNVVILDACRNNPFARSFRSSNNGLAQVDAPTGTLVAYSTAPGKVARDGTGRNGAYTAELLKQISVPGLQIEEVMKRVRASLKKLTNGEQVPWESSSLVGDFYFSGPIQAKITPSLEAVQTGPNAETEFWASVKSSEDITLLNEYLNKYPNGSFAELAHSEIGRLQLLMKEKAGRYRVKSAEARGVPNNFFIDIVMRGDKLFMVVVGQPEYELIRVNWGRFKVGSPAPYGFWCVFRPDSIDPSKLELFLEQPQGSITLMKVAQY